MRLEHRSTSLEQGSLIGAKRATIPSGGVEEREAKRGHSQYCSARELLCVQWSRTGGVAGRGWSGSASSSAERAASTGGGREGGQAYLSALGGNGAHSVNMSRRLRIDRDGSVYHVEKVTPTSFLAIRESKPDPLTPYRCHRAEVRLSTTT